MLKLDRTIRLDERVLRSPNLTGRFSDGDLDAIGNEVWEGWNRDKQSRADWEKRTQAAMNLAMQVRPDKTFPWKDCSNVAFPLVTIATMQFHARSYPAIIQGPELVRCKVNGPDPTGVETQRANRIGKHMSYQLLEEDTSWEEQHDRLLINIPIVGCAFKKTYYSGVNRQNRSELVMARDLVMDYYAKSVEACARKTHVVPFYRNEIHEGIMLGIYRDVRQASWYEGYPTPAVTATEAAQDKRRGTTPPPPDDNTPYTFLEQHTFLDLDGDGYKEPYIVTIEESSRMVVRLVARFDREEDILRNSRGEIVKITPIEYFTKYGFIPSPDGGVYDIGFGALLGPLNESVNSLLNQLVDAGTMANTAGGFLGRGAKIRGGVYSFSPLEWKRVDATVDDLRKSIFPLPVREPSAVLFQLLSLLINYTNRISGSTDTLVGENPGQNTPAYTTQTMVEQGMKIYNAIFKRVWRSMKEEFRKLYILNAIFLPPAVTFGMEGMRVLANDYSGDPGRIAPVADPSITSSTMRMEQATALKQAAMSTPGYNIKEVERNFLQALHIDNWELYYPGPDKVPQGVDPKVQLEQLRQQGKALELQNSQKQFLMELMEERRLNSAKILQLEAQAAKLLAEAGGAKSSQAIAAFEAAVGALKAHDDALRGRIELMLKSQESQGESNGKPSSDGRGMARLVGPPSDAGPEAVPEGMGADVEGLLG